MLKRNLYLCAFLFCIPSVYASDNPVIFSDGLTKVTDTRIDGYSLSGCFVSSAAANNHGLYPGAASIKTLGSSTKSAITLPAANSIAEFKFWMKRLDDDAPAVKVRRQVAGGAWEVIAEVNGVSKDYEEKVIAVNTGADDVKLQLYVEKTATQAGYYFDDFTLTGCLDCQYKEASFASIFTRNMVLQRDAPVKVWGVATEDMDLQLEIQGQTIETQARDGKFEFTLAPLLKGGPYSLRISWDGGYKQLDEIYVGDVWLAGGQSNMDFAMRKVTNAEKEMAETNHPMIKFFRVPKDYYEGHNKLSGDWESCTPDKISEAFAVPYYFAREVRTELDVPIGIIQCGLGGTSAESWMSREVILGDDRYRKELDDYDAVVSNYKPGEYEALLAKYQAGELSEEPIGPKNFRRPAGMYYTMFRKVIPFTIKGFLFYQGETNAKRGYNYRYLLPALMELWRSDMQQGDLPFLLVQLPKFNSSINWADIRESQTLVSKNDVNSGIAIAFDQGTPGDIHPTQKDTVGMRLGRLALNKIYQIQVPHRGPEFTRMNIRGSNSVLYFDLEQGSSLYAKGHKGVLKGFSVCGADKVFYAANAAIDGDSIIVNSPKVTNPVAVRYGWFSSGDLNLFSTDDFPAPPFRTDKYKLATQNDDPDVTSLPGNKTDNLIYVKDQIVYLYGEGVFDVYSIAGIRVANGMINGSRELKLSGGQIYVICIHTENGTTTRKIQL